MAINRYRLKHLAKKNRSAKRVSALLKRTDRLIGVILIGNNLANNLAAILAAYIAVRLYGTGSEFAAGIVLTILMLIFAEVTPKTIAAIYPEKIAFPASLLLKPLLWVLYPIVWIVNHVSNGLIRLLGINPNKNNDDALSKDELRTVVDESGTNIPTGHQGMLINILELEDVTVDDIMVPRNEIVGIDLDKNITDLIEDLVSSDYTRLPVYQGDVNNVVGMLHIRKVSRLLRGGAGEITKEAIKRFAVEPYFVPENTPLHKQLVNFQIEKRRCALVVDEYGEVQGLLALEDILEEIVGDFTTNQAEQVEEIVVEDKGIFQIDASATVRDINKFTGWELPVDGPKTLNGLAVELLENIPNGNVSFTIGEYRFETMLLDTKRIIKVRGQKVIARQLPLMPEE